VFIMAGIGVHDDRNRCSASVGIGVHVRPEWVFMMVRNAHQALTGFAHLPRGFRNRDLRPRVEAMLGRPYSTSQMTYDLRRLRLKGVIHRIPQTHRYTATSYGLKVAFFFAKLYLRILRPQWPALLPVDDQLPRPLRAALNTLDAQIRKIHEEAILAA
jgi:hypothetical protein